MKSIEACSLTLKRKTTASATLNWRKFSQACLNTNVKSAGSKVGRSARVSVDWEICSRWHHPYRSCNLLLRTTNLYKWVIVAARRFSKSKRPSYISLQGKKQRSFHLCSGVACTRCRTMTRIHHLTWGPLRPILFHKMGYGSSIAQRSQPLQTTSYTRNASSLSLRLNRRATIILARLKCFNLPALKKWTLRLTEA